MIKHGKDVWNDQIRFILGVQDELALENLIM